MNIFDLDNQIQMYFNDTSPPPGLFHNHVLAAMLSKTDNQRNNSSDTTNSSNVDVESLAPRQSPVFTALLSVSNTEAFNTYNIAQTQYLWCSEYANDIDQTLKEIEENRRPIYYHSPQIHFRYNLVQAIKCLGETLNLGRCTVHLAVYMQDVFMDAYKISEQKLNAVMLMCILLASKMQERDQNIPKIELLQSVVKQHYEISDLKSIEIRLLEFFDWYLLFPTAATFAESYVAQIIDVEEFNYFIRNREYHPLMEEKYKDINTWHSLTSALRSLIFEFLDLTLQEFSLVHALPSNLAAACLAAARHKIGISPVWNNRLVLVTGYTEKQIEKNFRSLINLKDTIDNAAQNNADSGFLSEFIDTDDENLSIVYAFQPKRARHN